MLARAIIAICKILPRGGHTLAKAARLAVPELANYPAPLSFGFVLRGDVAHNVFYPLTIHGHYLHQTAEDDLLAFLAKDCATIVDVGANIGTTSALLATFAPKAHIKAFEPLPVCRPYLDQVGAHFRNVEIVGKAMGSSPGLAEFSQRQSIDRSSFIGKGDAPVTQTISVEVSTLDAEMKGQSADLIKIDVEGFEPAVFEGGRETIIASSPYIVFEAYEADVFDASVSFLKNLRLGYEIYRINHSGSLHAADAQRSGDTCNYFACPVSRAMPPMQLPKSYAR